MSNLKSESTEIPSSPVKGPFSRTITRTYEVAPIAINVKVTETIEASHDVMIPELSGCDCHEEESSAIPGIPPGVPIMAIFERMFRSASTPGSDPGPGGAPNPAGG